MDPDAPVILARARALRRVKGMPDVLTLRLEARVPTDLRDRLVVIEQRLTRRDVARMLAAFDAAGRAGAEPGRPFGDGRGRSH